MGLFSRRKTENRTAALSSQPEIYYGTGSVRELNNLEVSTVYGCTRFLSDAVASMPISASEGSQEEDVESVETPLWLSKPNPTMTKFDWINQSMNSLLFSGNAYTLVIRDKTGAIQEIWPLDPSNVQVHIANGVKTLEVNAGSGGNHMLGPAEFLHIPGMMMPGDVVGVSPISMASRAITNAGQAQESSTAFIENGATPSGVISYKTERSSEAVKKDLATWNKRHGGSGNQGRIAILTGDASFNTVSVSAKDSQFLESRKFQVAEITRFFGLPSHVVGDTDGVSHWGTGISAQNTALVLFTLNGWTCRFDEALTELASSEYPLQQLGSKKKFIKLSKDHLLHGDFQTQVNTYATAVENNFMSVSTAQRLLGLPIEEVISNDG